MMTEMKPTGGYKQQSDQGPPEATLVTADFVDRPGAHGGGNAPPVAQAVGWSQGGGGQFTEPSYEESMQQLGGSSAVHFSQTIRKGFIRKVYGILSIQLLITGFICAVVLFQTGDTVNGYKTLGWGSTLARSTGLYICIFILSIALLFALFCYKSSYPLNFYLLGAWTVSMAVTVATACAVTMCDPMVVPDEGLPIPMSMVTGSVSSLKLPGGLLMCAIGTEAANSGINSVVLAAVLTGIIFVALTIFTFQSKWDFSFLGAGLGVALLMLIMWGFVMSIFGVGSRYLFAMAGSIIFSLYIVYDTWRLMNVYGPDDYIMAAIDLYLDVVNLFVMLLQLLQNRD